MLNTENQVQCAIESLKVINRQIKESQQAKEALEQALCVMLGHGENGSKTYKIDSNKVTLTTGWIYTLNKEVYEEIKDFLPKKFNPVTEKVAYELNKKIIRDSEDYADAEQMRLLCQILTKKPSKLSVRIAEVVE